MRRSVTGTPTRRPHSPREFVSYLWQFYLPKLSFMDPKIGPSFYGYRQVYIESFFGDFASFSVNYRPVYLRRAAAPGRPRARGAVHDGGRALDATVARQLARRRRLGHLLRRPHGPAAPRQLQLASRQQPDVVITGRYLLPRRAVRLAAAWVCSRCRGA